PPTEFAKQIHDNLKNVGDAFVMTDSPGKYSYIVVLEKQERAEPSEAGAYMSDGRDPDTLWSEMEKMRLQEWRGKVMHELREKAGLGTDDLSPPGDDGKPTLDQYGRPAYVKTYTVTEELTKKVLGDQGRE